MENQTKKETIHIAMNIFKYSFIIGSVLFLTYCATQYEPLIFVGLFYICVAACVNILMLLALFITLISYPKNSLETIKTIGLLLLNIPVALFYFWVITVIPTIFD